MESALLFSSDDVFVGCFNFHFTFSLENRHCQLLAVIFSRQFELTLTTEMRTAGTNSKHWFIHGDILPPTTARIDYVIGLRKTVS